MGTTVAIVQSNYIPWKGYFDLIHSADHFVLYDNVQYTRRDWRNRNRIKTPQGSAWLTIPVNSKGNYETPINVIEVVDAAWREQHWKTIQANYARAPHFSRYASELQCLYRECRHTRLSEINRYWIEAVCGWLDIRTPLSWSTEYRLEGNATERLVGICRELGADTYLSGPTARAYLEAERFEEAGIRLTYFDYSGYQPYRQLYPPFDHAVSVLDLILNEGPDATRFMLSF